MLIAPPGAYAGAFSEMEIYVKLAPRDYERLRSSIPGESPAREAIENATRVDHAVEGVLFEGYTIPCNEGQARIIRDIAKQCCPELIPAIDQAISLARPH
jgi:hypothetical protein